MRWSLGAALLVIAGQALAQSSAPATVRPYLWSSDRPKSTIGEINAFRRFSNERTAAMREFYGEVLGLPVLPATALGGCQMIRYPVGASEVKLFPVAPSPANTAGIADAAGVRLLTFFYADEAAVAQRFTARGLASPGFAPTTSHAAQHRPRSSKTPTENGSSSWSCRALHPRCSLGSRSASRSMILRRAGRSMATSWGSRRSRPCATNG
jgi:hypothetical protein